MTDNISDEMRSKLAGFLEESSRTVLDDFLNKEGIASFPEEAVVHTRSGLFDGSEFDPERMLSLRPEDLIKEVSMIFIGEANGGQYQIVYLETNEGLKSFGLYDSTLTTTDLKSIDQLQEQFGVTGLGSIAANLTMILMGIDDPFDDGTQPSRSSDEDNSN